MLNGIKRLYGKKLEASDDRVGHVEDCYFDNVDWAVRYVAADTDWRAYPRRLLLSPHALGSVSTRAKSLPVHLTRDQIEKSPMLDWQSPVTREFEMNYYRYYHWPFYWQGGRLWGPSDFPDPRPSNNGGQTPAKGDGHLISARKIFGFHVYSGADSDGRVADLLMDQETWHIGYLVLDTSHWYSHKEVLISTRKILSIDEIRGRVNVAPTKAEIARVVLRPVSHGRAAVCEPAMPLS
jgi:hypothetical protein